MLERDNAFLGQNQFGTNIVEDESQTERGFCRKIWKKTKATARRVSVTLFLYVRMGVTDSVGDLSV